MTFLITLEYCSLQFAECWFGRERFIVDKLDSTNRDDQIDGLKRGAAYFSVARTLPRAKDVDRGLSRYEPVLQALECPRNQWGAGEVMVEVVSRLSEDLGETYGGYPLSAASKFLWLAHQDPFVIFDSQARKALGTPERDYSSFVECWENSFSSLREEIEAACKTLGPMRLYLPKGHLLSEQEVKETVEQEWFTRRVYDIYLWETGGNI